MVEGEAGAVGGFVVLVLDWGQVPAGDAGFEDEVFVGLGDAASVVYDDQLSVAAGSQGGGDVDVAGACVAGVTEKLEEGVLDRVEAPGGAAGAFGTGQAGEALP